MICAVNSGKVHFFLIQTTPHTSNERFFLGEHYSLIIICQRHSDFCAILHGKFEYMRGRAATPHWSTPHSSSTHAHHPAACGRLGRVRGRGWVVVGGVQIRCIIGVWRRLGGGGFRPLPHGPNGRQPARQLNPALHSLGLGGDTGLS